MEHDDETSARDVLELKSPEALTDAQHVALAIYTLADVLAAYLEVQEFEDDED